MGEDAVTFARIKFYGRNIQVYCMYVQLNVRCGRKAEEGVPKKVPRGFFLHMVRLSRLRNQLRKC